MHNLVKIQWRVDKNGTTCFHMWQFLKTNWTLQLKQGYHQNFNVSLFIITFVDIVTM
jgi:hypothetical protein